MYLTGFADEAGGAIDIQIKATRELGWSHIEARNVNGKNIHNLSDQEFDRAAGRLDEAGIRVNCFGSEIANWGRQVTDPFEQTLELVERTIPRMQRLGSKLVRIMSYAVIKDESGEIAADQMKEERFRRLRELVRRFSEAGITPVHENCMNYGGMSWRHSLELVEQVPGLRLVYDTGNPVFTYDYAEGPSRDKQSSWEFYRRVREHIAYVHIKDARYVGENPGSIFPKAEFTFAGEGDGEVRRMVKDLLDGGYDGGISMEPHLAVVFHDDSQGSPDEIKYANYVEYGCRFMQLLTELGHPVG